MDSVTIEALGRSWQWPAADRECRRVVFDTTTDLEHAYRHCRAFDVAVQAGGNMGVWPWRMAQKFKHVVTFEPDPACYPYLQQNLAGVPNVSAINAALLDCFTKCGVVTENAVNMGAQFVSPGVGEVPTVTIDSLDLHACNLIYLDIEGAELLALHGAVETIMEYSPVIAVEDKGLSSRFGSQKGDIEKWLEQYGYKVVARVHRDVVLACG